MYAIASATPKRKTSIVANPLPQIDDTSFGDPCVVAVNDSYFYCGAEDDKRIFIIQSSMLKDIVNQRKHFIFSFPSGHHYSQNVWSPMLQFLRGRWYVYFAADDGKNENHRMFALEGE